MRTKQNNIKQRRHTITTLCALLMAMWLWGNALLAQQQKKGVYEDLQEALRNPMDVLSLDLSEQDLTVLPKEITKLTNLTKLKLFGNKLTVLPKEIGNLTSLKELYLHYNKLITLPKEIGNLTNLTILDLSHNKLTALPKEIGNLTNLKILDLKGNELSYSSLLGVDQKFLSEDVERYFTIKWDGYNGYDQRDVIRKRSEAGFSLVEIEPRTIESGNRENTIVSVQGTYTNKTKSFLGEIPVIVRVQGSGGSTIYYQKRHTMTLNLAPGETDRWKLNLPNIRVPDATDMRTFHITVLDAR